MPIVYETNGLRADNFNAMDAATSSAEIRRDRSQLRDEADFLHSALIHFRNVIVKSTSLVKANTHPTY